MKLVLKPMLTKNLNKYYYDLFYPEVDGKRKKRVPQNIKNLLTAEGLAYWFMMGLEVLK